MQRVKQSSSQVQQQPHKNRYQFLVDKDKKIIITSNFDNGNINLIKQITEFNYRLEAVQDTNGRCQQKKSWFHFRVTAPKNTRIRFSIENVNIYENMYENQDRNWAKPFVKDNGKWKQIKDAFLSYRDQIILIFDYTFSTNSQYSFCITIPFSYQDSENYLHDLKYRVPQQIAYNDTIITKSFGQLNVHMLKLTAKQQNQTIIHKKPIILITCRVHPGQVSSSYCLMGLIDMLLRSYNLQSMLILKMFQFIIFPVVNPDGIYQGNYRMDTNNYNLNRVYGEPSPLLHPPVFKIKQIVTQLAKTRKILFHFDLHSHSAMKSAFIYGNAYQNIINQTQSEVFCKILQQNCQVFKYSISQFGQKHMKMKDRGQSMTKQGCSRVVFNKLANTVYSYTVQTSIFPYPYKQPTLPANNRTFKCKEFDDYQETDPSNITSRLGPKHQMIIDNMLLGQNILISILDILQKNPYSRLVTDSLELYRKQISQQLFQNQQRFKLMDTKAYQKIKSISKHIREEFGSRYPKIWDFIVNDKQFGQVQWPDCMKWFTLTNTQQQKRRGRIKTQSTDNRDLNQFINPKNRRKNQIFQNNTQQKHKKPSVPPQNFPIAINNQLQLPQIKQQQKQKKTHKTVRVYKKSCQSQKSYKIHQNNVLQNFHIKEADQINTLRQQEMNLQKNIQTLPDENMGELTERSLKNSQNPNFIIPSNKQFPKNKFSLMNKISNSKLVKKQTKSAKIIETILNPNKSKNLTKATCEEIIKKRKLNIQDDSQIQSFQPEIKEKQSLISPLKKQINRMRYNQARRRNIIRQDIKLPELRIKGSLLAGNAGQKISTLPDLPDLPDQY